MSDAVNTRLDEIRELATAEQYESAYKELEQLSQTYPEDARIVACRAFVTGREGDKDAAVRAWSAAIALCGLEPHYYYMRGADLFCLGRYKDAIADFTKVLELCDYHRSDYYRRSAYFFRADAYVRTNKIDLAKADCVHIPHDTQIWTDRLRSKADLEREISAGPIVGPPD